MKTGGGLRREAAAEEEEKKQDFPLDKPRVGEHSKFESLGRYFKV